MLEKSKRLATFATVAAISFMAGVARANGPMIPYVFQGIVRKYKVDFMINDLLIEIKDNHIWYRNDIKSGKNEAKINAVKEEIQKGNYKEYYLITPDIWVNTLKTIKQHIKSK
jgi:hypothetical protein